MCNMCYHAVCSRRTRAQNCGDERQGGVDVGALSAGTRRRNTVTKVATMKSQATPAYHCHVAMGDQGTCDYAQYEQHESSRKYHMDHGVMCGWRNIKYLNLTHCDCTLNTGKANACGRNQCLEMAYEGVVCGNCGGCNQNRAFGQIFSPRSLDETYSGVCAAVRTASTEEEARSAKMFCSQGLFCRGSDLSSANCQFHCTKFPEDPKCTPANRRLRAHVAAEVPKATITLDMHIHHDAILAGSPPIRRTERRFAVSLDESTVSI